ncbi:hypothetical protein NKR17_08810 [Priestia flexa]|nr:hypothetical protein [Priestia flexa]MEC0668332.1 hypothetical protein [Priestia flexa]
MLRSLARLLKPSKGSIYLI